MSDELPKGDGEGIAPPLAWAKAHRNDADVPKTRMRLLPQGETPGTFQNPIQRVERAEYEAAVVGKGVARLAAAAPIVDVRLADVRSPQRGLNAERLSQHLDNPDLVPKGAKASGSGMVADVPVVVRKDGKLYLYDGNHRLTAARLRGKQYARCRLVDLDAQLNPAGGK